MGATGAIFVVSAEGSTSNDLHRKEKNGSSSFRKHSNLCPSVNLSAGRGTQQKNEWVSSGFTLPGLTGLTEGARWFPACFRVTAGKALSPKAGDCQLSPPSLGCPAGAGHRQLLVLGMTRTTSHGTIREQRQHALLLISLLK